MKALIKKGTMVAVSIKGDNITDKRFFTVNYKLNQFLRFIKKQGNCKIKFKQLRVN